MYCKLNRIIIFMKFPEKRLSGDRCCDKKQFCGILWNSVKFCVCVSEKFSVPKFSHIFSLPPFLCFLYYTFFLTDLLFSNLDTRYFLFQNMKMPALPPGWSLDLRETRFMKNKTIFSDNSWTVSHVGKRKFFCDSFTHLK